MYMCVCACVCMYIFVCANVSFKATGSLLIFCLYLYTDVSEVLMSLTIISLLSISPIMSINICFIYLCTPMLGLYMFTNVTSFLWIDHFIII